MDMRRDTSTAGAASGKPGASDREGRPVVLQVLPALVTGGAERGCVDVAKALAAAGGTALVASEGGPLVRELERGGARHFTLPLNTKNPLRIRRNATRLAELIREWDVDIVHARSRAPAWSAWLAARRTGVHFMTTFHAPYNFSNALKRHYNSVMARGERVIAISSFIADHIRANYPVAPGAIRLIHRGIDLNIFSPDQVAPSRLIQLAKSWRLPDDRKVVMLPGRLTRWKGQAVLLEALGKLKRRDVHCVLVGSDQGRTGYRRELEAMIERLGLTGAVLIADHCNDMPAAYMLANVVVSASSDPEAFGRVIVEAQAMGRPVIVTNHGAVGETVVAGHTAWTVPPSDPNALADALTQALALDDAQRAELASRAIAHVSGRFTREKMCADTLAVYRELMDEERALPSESAATRP